MSLFPSTVGRALFLRQQWVAKRYSPSSFQRFFASSQDDDDKRPKVVLQKLGDFPYGSREYRLVLQRPQQLEQDDDSKEEQPMLQPLASLRAHRNIIFGAQLFGETAKKKTLEQVCLPLLDEALEDAFVEGDQPQAMATLHGLCDYVSDCLQQDELPSQALQDIKALDDELLSFHAVQAIATGIPRQGHSIVGQGTFRDGESGWEALAKEFIEKNMADEVELYSARGGTVVAIEHLADTSPQYLKSAGGAMARLFFVV